MRRSNLLRILYFVMYHPAKSTGIHLHIFDGNATIAQDNQTLHDIAQLPHIARPRQLLQLFNSLRIYLSAFNSVLTTYDIKEIIHQQGNIIHMFRQQRHMYYYHTESVIEVLTKIAPCYLLCNVFVGCRHQPFEFAFAAASRPR